MRSSKETAAKAKCVYGQSGGTIRSLLWLCAWILLLTASCIIGPVKAEGQLPWQSSFRKDQLLDDHWLSIADSVDQKRYDGFEQGAFNDDAWQSVSLPHNWDTYGGYIRNKHGNFHGDAWYRKTFRAESQSDEASFLFFEGVSSYATVYLNGHLVGRHAGGRTSFSIEVSRWLKPDGSDNLLAVKVRHPAGIRDLPWVCGGCSDEVGFSEGSQPFGIFRPVHLIQTGKISVIPFGVHVYNDTTVNKDQATLFLETTIKNYCKDSRRVIVRQQLIDRAGKLVKELSQFATINADKELVVNSQLHLRGDVHLWSLEDPYLYHLKTQILDGRSEKLLDELETPYGIRWIKWPERSAKGPKQFLLNGKPVFINGIAGYEHALGNSHAFTAEEIATRVSMIRSMGFNAFRDAHQPHNLRYQHYWDSEGVLWWPQFSAHIWFDTPAFKKQFLSLLRDWVLERRNSPSNIMWGLQNESQLPADFARQCVNLIRSLDPTASTQRLISTCNGGEGTDWDVPQNWSGTYGGDPDTYSEDLKKEVLVGEYGGWRTMDVHAEGGFKQKGAYSIESWCALLEKKIRLAWQVRDSVCGQFLWLFNSHDNPGREQAAEGYRDLDKIGPVNYKGLLTSWEEPTEAVYLYQSNFTDADTSPMVHIASHQWAGRWHNIRETKDVVVYSNCDSVRLYNGINTRLLGTRRRAGIGTHFIWKNIRLDYNVLYAVGYHKGKKEVVDLVHLNNLPVAPETLDNKDGPGTDAQADIVSPAAGYDYLYRFNCGGPSYRDHFGHDWAPDRAGTTQTYGSRSWTADYKGLPPFFASQRSITEPIKGTSDDGLFQTFRYGRDKLNFDFPVPDGDYRVELYFAEPWWGIGTSTDCTGWRSFDVAVNGKVRLSHFDIFSQAGSLGALKKVIDVKVKSGHIHIGFPEIYSGQAIIAAIAIARKKTEASADNFQIANAPMVLISSADTNDLTRPPLRVQDWLNTGDTTFLKTAMPNGRSDNFLPVHISGLPAALFGSQWLQSVGTVSAIGQGNGADRKPGAKWVTNEPLNMYVAISRSDRTLATKLGLDGFTNTNTTVEILSGNKSVEDSLDVYEKRLTEGALLREASWWDRSIISFKPVDHMQPPYDQKKEITYDLTNTFYSKGGELQQRAGKQCVLFSPATDRSSSERDSLGWPLTTGVADFHSFQVKYACPAQDSVQATLRLIAADGKLMAESAVWLTHTKEGKWNNCYVSTPTMINAGKYHLIIEWKKAAVPVYMYSLKLR